MKYSASEIMEMRGLIRETYPSGVSYYPEHRAADVERQLITYMNNETPVEELRELVRHLREKEFQWHIKREKMMREAMDAPKVPTKTPDEIRKKMEEHRAGLNRP